MEQSTRNIETQENVAERTLSHNDEEPSTSNYDSQGNVKKKIHWTFLEHKGPIFEPPYQPLPKHVNFKYKGNVKKLSQDAEELAGLYAKKLHRSCVTDATFNENFFAGWRAVMTQEEKELIKDLSKCDFKEIQEYYKIMAKLGKTEKKRLNKKEKNIYGYCKISTNNSGERRKEQIKNYKIEPSDLFCSKSPLMGTLKKRVTPGEITINCSTDSKIPESPPGENWKAVIHDNSVSWLATWQCNINDTHKYVILDSISNPKQTNDMIKYETARKLHQHIDTIRRKYQDDWKAEDTVHRQRGVALYFIDTLGFRAGNEKEPGQADTVGCCSLKVKHIQLCENNEIAFDFCGKASIVYKNKVRVEEFVYDNISSFIENKNENDDLFDQLNTIEINKYLQSLMPNLTAKVFRTYKASAAFEKRLHELTNSDRTYYKEMEKMVELFNQAKLEVTIMLNHKKNKSESEKNKNKLQTTSSSTDNTIYNTSTAMSYYIDPRIAVTWCERYDIPIDKIYTGEKLRKKFSWAIAEAGPNFVFCW